MFTLIKYLRIKFGYREIAFIRGADFESYFKDKIIARIMESGRFGLYQLIDYTTYGNPSGMTQSSSWEFIGFYGNKKVRDMSYKEFKILSKTKLPSKKKEIQENLKWDTDYYKEEIRNIESEENRKRK